VRALVDTNVVSELRKGPRCHPGVIAWLAACSPEDLFLSVLVIGEIRRGVERIRRRDRAGAHALDAWLARVVSSHGDRILPVDLSVAEQWGRLDAARPIPVIAATARVHNLTLVTRNIRDVARTGVACFSPWERA
jgi:predicted nucleic acid-binding protein